MKLTWKKWASVLLLCILLVSGAFVGLAIQGASARGSEPQAKHVLLISVDGLHQSDLMWYVGTHRDSTLASLVKSGVEFTNAQTPFPSDSFPGMTGPMTGGNPKSTGIYYDDTFNRSLYPPAGYDSNGHPNPLHDCTGQTLGTEVTYFEALDKNPLALDAGEGLSGLPATILGLTQNATSLIDPQQLPRDASCNPVYPHQYIKVNTIMEVAHSQGLLTAWSDKHPAYELFNGNSGTGVTDYFTPEINSQANQAGQDWTQDNMLTRMYDTDRVDAVINWINGFDHTGTIRQGTPAIFGMNFQTVSTAEKLPTSSSSTPRVTLSGGYMADGVTPGPLLQEALQYINDQVGRMVAALKDRGLDKRTVIILTAKHGQSPQLGSALTRIKDSTIMDQLNAAWVASHPNNPSLVAFSVNDDGMLIWLSDRSAAAETFAKNFLLGYNGNGTGTDGKAKATDINGNPKAYTQAGNATIYAGQDAANFIGVPFSDARVPDLIGIAQYGTVYTGGKGKIAEHGGDNAQDRHVPILVSGGPVGAGGLNASAVETTQIAPTILELLGLDPNALQAVQMEHTQLLPLGQ
jgi:hypothetical protein